jgi:hypothetical protein
MYCVCKCGCGVSHFVRYSASLSARAGDVESARAENSRKSVCSERHATPISLRGEGRERVTRHSCGRDGASPTPVLFPLRTRAAVAAYAERCRGKCRGSLGRSSGVRFPTDSRQSGNYLVSLPAVDDTRMTGSGIRQHSKLTLDQESPSSSLGGATA